MTSSSETECNQYIFNTLYPGKISNAICVRISMCMYVCALLVVQRDQKAPQIKSPQHELPMSELCSMAVLPVPWRLLYFATGERCLSVSIWYLCRSHCVPCMGTVNYCKMWLMWQSIPTIAMVSTWRHYNEEKGTHPSCAVIDEWRPVIPQITTASPLK